MSALRWGPSRGYLPSSSSLAACATFLVLMPLGVVGMRAWDLNPLTSQGASAPVSVALAALVVMSALALVVRREWVAGAAAGVFAAWCGSAVAASLVGTPFGYGTMLGDAGRMSALATHFASTWVPSDAADPDLPPEYPPLYPMLVGRFAALTGREAWALLGTAQSLLIALSVLAGFLAWRRLVPAGVALALSGTVLVGLEQPSKGNEVLALSVFLPLVLGAFAVPEGRRPIHPVIAGIGFGLMVPLYPNFLMFGLLGIGLVMLVGWRTSPEPRAYLVQAAVTVGIAAVLASWYLGPLLVAYSQGRTEVVADLFKSGALANTQFALLGSRSWALFALQLTGAAGVLVLWRRAWWARPMGLLAAGLMVVKAVMLLRFVDGGHSFMLLYVPYLMRFMAAAAGVLTLWEAARLLGPVLRTRLATPPRLVGVAAVAALVGVIGASAYAGSWLVMPAGYLDANGAKASGATSLSTAAHAEYRPDGTRPRYPYGTMAPLFPAAQVYRDIDDELGKGADPVVLSADQRVFSFRDLRNYLPPARESSNALTLWDTRERGLREIAAIDDPARLAAALAHTDFGPVDVLVLQEKRGKLLWRNIEFSPRALAGPQFAAYRRLPGGFAVFVRKG